MANLIYKGETIKFDNSTGTATDITAWLTSETMTGAQDVIEDSSLADEERSYLPGIAGATIQFSGIVNSTTHALFGGYVGNRTTGLRTYQRGATSALILRGEVLPTSVEYSGSVNSLQTFSFSGTVDGIMTKTTAFAA